MVIKEMNGVGGRGTITYLHGSWFPVPSSSSSRYWAPSNQVPHTMVLGELLLWTLWSFGVGFPRLWVVQGLGAVRE